MSKDLVLWLVVAELVLSGLILFYKGAVGSVRRYTMVDAVLGIIELSLIAWAVFYLAS